MTTTIEKEFEWEYGLTFEKVANDDGRRIIAGYASHGAPDEDDEMMDMASLKDVFHKYMTNPVVRFMHNRTNVFQGAIGKVIPEYTAPDGTFYKSNFDEGKPFLVIEISKSPLIDPILGYDGRGLV